MILSAYWLFAGWSFLASKAAFLFHFRRFRAAMLADASAAR